MQRVPAIILSVSLVLACVVAGIQVYEKLGLQRQLDELMADRDTLRSQVGKAEQQVKELTTRFEQESKDFASAELEFKNTLALKDQTIREQENLLREMGAFRASLDQVRLEQADQKDWRDAIEEQGQLVAYLGDKLKGTTMTIYRQDPYVVVQIPQSSFQLGSTQASKALLEGLQVVSNVVKAYQGTYLLAVEGHTDNVPLKRDSMFASNWELGAARANRVVQNLLRLGVDPKDLAVVSRSQYMPVNAYEKPTSDDSNRRIELVFAPRRMVVRQSETPTQPATEQESTPSTTEPESASSLPAIDSMPIIDTESVE